jgi:D-amino-acid dehydrogenase
MTKSYAADLVHAAAPSKCHFSCCTRLFHTHRLPPVHTHNFPAWLRMALALFKGQPSPYIDFQSTT